ncbi:hypothetical protein CEXT_757811 [Caerostris extrusa]|uniref:Uncharacterized protein n=1 Tax=Caerostris extrusa TaxID=172846 RepID=A0AAV4P719_CAEEX|nr:hypothetical protein CEXT_757811 [Caerostris extrusa]
MQKSGRRPRSGKTDVTALTETIGVFDQRKCRDGADWAISMRDIGKGSLHVYIAGNAKQSFWILIFISYCFGVNKTRVSIQFMSNTIVLRFVKNA